MQMSFLFYNIVGNLNQVGIIHFKCALSTGQNSRSLSENTR